MPFLEMKQAMNSPTKTFSQRDQGDGRAIDFIATDIYRIANGRIAENWHLEDNLTLLQQLGAISR